VRQPMVAGGIRLRPPTDFPWRAFSFKKYQYKQLVIRISR
jgi:hypothetical protein